MKSQLAEEKAIVTRLTSIEQLASMTMLCSDKTGTLTMNKMELQDDITSFVEDVDGEGKLNTHEQSRINHWDG